MLSRVVWIVAVAGLGLGTVACSSDSYRVGGKVHGIWDGGDGVALRLQADGVDSLLTVPVDGEFEFPAELAQGASYSVMVVASPVLHSCAVDAGGNGVLGRDDVSTVSIACVGPAVTIDFAGFPEWQFDPTQRDQAFGMSSFVAGATFVIDGPGLVTATVNNSGVPIGAPAPALQFTSQVNTFDIALTARGGLHIKFVLRFDRPGNTLQQRLYGKSLVPGVLGGLGQALALDGDVLAVGAPGESTGSPGQINVADAGVVYVYRRAGATWGLEAQLVAPAPRTGAGFGTAVALSGDTLVVGEPATNVSIGEAYVFVHGATGWTVQAALEPAARSSAEFGHAVAVSGDTVAVGAPHDSSPAVGVDGDSNPFPDAAPDSGAVYVFHRDATTWTQQAYVKASNTGANDQFGSSVALTESVLAVGAPGEASATTFVNGPQNDDSAPAAGAAYVFVHDASGWRQEAYVKPSNAAVFQQFGAALALDHATLAIGAVGEAGGSTGVNGDPHPRGGPSGAVYVFLRATGNWNQQAYIKASNASGGDQFGSAVALSGDLLAVGATGEASAANRSDGNQDSDAMPGAGAAYLFVRSATSWAQTSYLKASNVGASDHFGASIAIGPALVAVGATGESSAVGGIGQANGSNEYDFVPGAGAFYLFQ